MNNTVTSHYSNWFFSSTKYRYYLKSLSKLHEFEIDIDGTLYLHINFEKVALESIQNFAFIFDDCEVYETKDEIEYECDDGYVRCTWNKVNRKGSVVIECENEVLFKEFCQLCENVTDKDLARFLINAL